MKKKKFIKNGNFFCIKNLDDDDYLENVCEAISEDNVGEEKYKNIIKNNKNSNPPQKELNNPNITNQNKSVKNSENNIWDFDFNPNNNNKNTTPATQSKVNDFGEFQFFENNFSENTNKSPHQNNSNKNQEYKSIFIFFIL